MSRDEALRYISGFDVDTDRLGKQLSAGKQHQIFHYGQNQVVKIPRRSLYMKMYGSFHYETIVRDLNILQEYLGEFVVPTQVLRSSLDEADYLILQERLVDAQFLTGTIFPAVREDLVQIAQANARIIQKHRVSVDFFGNIGFQQSLLASLMRRKEMALMNNLLVVRHNGQLRIKITDTNLSELRFHFHEEVSLGQWVMDSLVFTVTRFLMRDNFGIVI